MSSLNTLRSLCLALFAGVALAGCNVFEGLYEPGSSNNPEVLLVDAELAMQSGEPEKAVVMLEKALQRVEPESTPALKVSSALGTAKLSAAGVGVLQFQRFVEDLNDQIDNGTGASGKAIAVTSGVCSFGAPHVAVEELSFENMDAYKSLANNGPLFEEIEAMINRYTGIAERLERTIFLGADDPNDWSTLRARMEQDMKAIRVYYTEEEIKKYFPPAFLNTAISIGGTAYLNISKAGGADLKWYRVKTESGYTIGYCAPSEETIAAVRAKAACSMNRLRRAAFRLEYRAYLIGENSVAREVADLAKEGVDKLQDELGGECPA